MGQDAQKLVGTIRDALGAFAALGVVVYITGGAIVGLRLAAVHLPTTAVVGQLPRNVLISVGLAEGVLPIVIIGAGYMGLRSLLYRKEAPAWPNGFLGPRTKSYARTKSAWPKGRLGEMWGGKAGDHRAQAVHILWTVVMTALVLAPAVLTAVLNPDSTPRRNTGFFAGLFGVLAFLTWLIMLLYLNMRARILERYRADMTAVRPTLLHSLLVVVALVPGSIAFWSTRPLEEAVACLTPASLATTASTVVSGYLIGETSDHVYIGEIGGSHPSLISLPAAQVRQVVSGKDARGNDCDSTQPD